MPPSGLCEAQSRGQGPRRGVAPCRAVCLAGRAIHSHQDAQHTACAWLSRQLQRSRAQRFIASPTFPVSGAACKPGCCLQPSCGRWHAGVAHVPPAGAPSLWRSSALPIFCPAVINQPSSVACPPLHCPAFTKLTLISSSTACPPCHRGYYADIPFVSESVYHQVQLSEYA